MDQTNQPIPTPRPERSAPAPTPAGDGAAIGTGAVDSRPTPLAAFLGWILPGLGYVSQGQTGRGLAVGGSILGLILAGLLIGGPDAIDSREERWWFLVQAAGGPVVIALDQVHQRVLKVPSQDARPYRVSPHPDPAMNPGNRPPAFTRSVARVNESARLYIVIAGMLNMIAVLDCMVIRRGRSEPGKGVGGGGNAKGGAA